jgi:hypothetical protein
VTCPDQPLDPLDPERIARLLGADASIPLPSGGPFALERREDLASLLGEERWRRLESVAATLRAQGRDATAMQLALELIDRGLEKKPQ